MYKTFKTELGTVILIEDENDTQLLGIVPEVSAIDFEWKTGKQSKISVIQIAFYQPEFKQHICLVFRQWNSTLMMQFLSNHKKRKIIASKITSRDSDFIKLALTFRQEFYDGCGFVSLQVLAESKGCPVGLKSLCEKFDLEYQDLHYKFHQKWASQWSLEEEQIMVRYAAHDAILALLLWYKLSALPDAASEKSKYPCRQMMKHGSCSKKDCVYSHSLITCDKCHIVCTDEKGWKQHINGRKHQQTLAELQEEYKSEFHCNECTRNFASQNALRYHMKSMEHRKTLYVLKFKHQKEESQSDKDGFSVSAEGVFDLGVISDVNLHVPLTFVVESKHQVDGYLTDIQFVNKDSNCVELVPSRIPKYPLKMSGNCQATLKFECDSKKLGYYQSELAFHFQRGSHTYVISRTVKAYVGEKDLFEQLMPKVPYKKKVYKPAIVSDDGDYIGAGKIPELNSDLSRYVRKLNFYDVPSKVRQVLFAPASTRELPVHQEFAMEFLPHDYAPLGSYSQHYSHLLWAEEAQLEVDIRQFSMFGVDVISQARGRSFVIKVPGLAEGRPSILIGDSILVKKSNDRNARAFEGRAVEMRLDEVVLKFNPKFNDRYINGEKYDVQFKYNRNPWRRMQLAIATSSEMLTGFDTLYRGKEAEKKSLVAEKELKMVDEYRWQPFNRMLFDNPEQRRAVSIIVNDSFHPFPFLIHGPPGTGKTVTIVEGIKQILHLKKDCRILVTAPSNSAADLLLDRLSQNLTKRDIFRLNAISRSQPMDPKLEQYTSVSRSTANRYDIPDVKNVLKFRIVVTTCCSAAVLSGIGVPSGHFTHVFIDEGGQALEPEAMIPLNTFDHPPSTRIIIAGDHKQLGPIIHSNVARKLGLGISLLERLISYCQWDRPSYSYKVFKMHNPRKGKSDYEKYGRGSSLYCVKLLKNYRSHESILTIPNELFYKSELQVCADTMVSNRFVGWSKLPNKDVPVMFMHTLGKDMREGDSPSWFNITEIQQITKTIQAIRENPKFQGISNDQIGVITPYNKQAQSIRSVLRNRFDGVSVGTVETFQGQERMVIIISTVRSNPEYMDHDSKYNLGFLNDPKRFNVAMTRAKALLVVIGNGNILCQDPSWRKWIEYCIDQNCVTGLDAELKDNLKKELKDLEDVESDDEVTQAEESGWREME